MTEPDASQTADPPLRVLILNQPFAPDVVATAQIAKDLADALVSRGHDVTALASRSIYGSVGATLPKRETIDGITVRRVGANLFGKSSTLGRIADFALYYVHAISFGLFHRRFDVVIALTTPPYIALVGALMKKLRRTRLIYWLMDVYPDVMVSHGMVRERRLAHRALCRLHRYVLNKSDATIALGRCMKDRLIAQGADADSIHIVRPWSPAPAFSPSANDDNSYRKEWNAADRLLIAYCGNFGLAHDVQTFLDAAKELRDDDRFLFAFVGGGKRKAAVEMFVKDNDLTNCAIAPYQPLEKLPELLAAADVHLVTMAPSMSGLVVPSKFFGVAGAGRATIFVGPANSEIARCIEDWSAGVVIEPGDSASLVRTLNTFADDEKELVQMGARARAGFAQFAERTICTQSIIELVEAADAPKANVVPATSSEAA